LNARVGRDTDQFDEYPNDVDLFDDGELRVRAATVRAEWRAGEDEWTRAAYEQFEHARTLVDVARACLHRGDRVSFLVGDVTFTGTITAVGPDSARVQVGADPDDVVDVHLGVAAGVVLRIDAHARAGGSRGDGALSFRARALELEEAPEVLVGLEPRGLVLGGRLGVGRDHLRIVAVDGTETHAPLASVSWLRRAPR
jgi:hypothetical protein